MSLKFPTYLAVGRLLVWLLMEAPLFEPVRKISAWTKELFGCDLCLGFWVYLFLALFLPVRVLSLPRVVAKVIFAAIATTTAHLLRIGWEERFRSYTEEVLP